MWLLWRTSEEGRQAPPKVRILTVLVVVLRFALHAYIESCDSLGLRTRNGRATLKDMKDIVSEGCGATGSGAQWTGPHHHDEGRPATPL